MNFTARFEKRGEKQKKEKQENRGFTNLCTAVGTREAEKLHLDLLVS